MIFVLYSHYIFVFYLLPQKRRKLHTVFRINHVIDNFVVIQDGLGDIQPQAAAAAVPVPGFVHPVERPANKSQVEISDF